MEITRGHQSNTRREWDVVVAGRRYRAECVWSGGSQRMEWYVSVEVSPPQVQTHWRAIKGQWIIAAVREYEVRREALTT